MNPDGGYVRLYRRLWDNPAFRTKQEAAVFAWMVSAAQWRETRISTKFGPVVLGVGEVLIAERTLADDFGLHRNTVRLLFQRLIDEGIIERFLDRTPNRAGTVVRIVNYKAYQWVEGDCADPQDRKRTADGTGAGPHEDRKRTKNKEGNTGKEGKEGISLGAAAPTGPADTARGSRLPADWTLPPDLAAYAASLGMTPTDIEREAENFRDYWTAAPGAKGRKADWPATWRTWCRKSMERKNVQRRTVQGEFTGFAALAVEQSRRRSG